MSSLFSRYVAPQFSKELPADVNRANRPREVYRACFSFVSPVVPKDPELVHVSDGLLSEWNLKKDDVVACLDELSGSKSVAGFEPYAMCYGGHQFGHWAGQLGDGRAINIAELDLAGSNWTFQLKGSGPTPYSRGADGFAVLRSSIREYLCSEAMHGLGVPTTRALSLVKTGRMVTRDMLYNGNPEDEPGAIVCRVAPSFIRFGNLELFAARGDLENLRKLADFTIKHHFPHLETDKNPHVYVDFFQEVAMRTLDMIIHWQRVGFVHGVMNTDNMSILGLTIDYGPYGWLEDYDPHWTPNTTDALNRRYRFGNQPSIALWNLAQLANALYVLVGEVQPLQEVLDHFRSAYGQGYHTMMCHKLGLFQDAHIPESFILDLQDLLVKSKADMTIFFRGLTDDLQKFNDLWERLGSSSCLEPAKLDPFKEAWRSWHKDYQGFIMYEELDPAKRTRLMNKVNPKYVLRNWMAQSAIEQAEQGDYTLINELYAVLQNPYDEQPDRLHWYTKRPDWANQKIGCAMLSCSS